MDPETGTHTFCEPAQSTCKWACHKSTPLQEITWKMRRPRWIPRPRTMCASLRSRNALGHVTRAIVCQNLEGKCRAPLGFRDRNSAQTCAVETHMGMSQEPSYAGIYTERGAPQIDPVTAAHTLRLGHVCVHFDWPGLREVHVAVSGVNSRTKGLT